MIGSDTAGDEAETVGATTCENGLETADGTVEAGIFAALGNCKVEVVVPAGSCVDEVPVAAVGTWKFPNMLWNDGAVVSVDEEGAAELS